MLVLLAYITPIDLRNCDDNVALASSLSDLAVVGSMPDRDAFAKSQCKGKHKSPIPITFANGSYIALSIFTNTMSFNTLAPRSNPRKPVETKNSQGSRGNLASPGSSQIQKNPTRKPDSSVISVIVSIKVVVAVTMYCCSQLTVTPFAV